MTSASAHTNIGKGSVFKICTWSNYIVSIIQIHQKLIDFFFLLFSSKDFCCSTSCTFRKLWIWSMFIPKALQFSIVDGNRSVLISATYWLYLSLILYSRSVVLWKMFVQINPNIFCCVKKSNTIVKRGMKWVRNPRNHHGIVLDPSCIIRQIWYWSKKWSMYVQSQIYIFLANKAFVIARCHVK